jgi:hypothetical protein
LLGFGLALAGTSCASFVEPPMKVVCFIESRDKGAVFSCWDEAGKRTELEPQDRYTCFSPTDANLLLSRLKSCTGAHNDLNRR